ncbi:MAG TPA: class I SAM-dependent methyltransferase [Longimicrobium sp.]|nr:class I SAM-dependent methyltransferase [Longimicrobium sp.]
MQAYGPGFARVYNLKWAGYAQRVAPALLEFHAARTPAGGSRGNVLDLCCGTGLLAWHFLEKGYRVVGIDLSAPMLEHARATVGAYVATGQATFIEADARDFTLDERFGLVVSTYDALNHLDDLAALRSCFECVSAVCDGAFVFDLNTRVGLRRWNSIEVDESRDDAVILTRGVFDDGSGKAYVNISGFVAARDGLYERFSETVFNTVFEMASVRTALLETGFRDVYFATVQDPSRPIAEPELESRVFVVATK